jgi:hypothetical protein
MAVFFRRFSVVAGRFACGTRSAGLIVRVRHGVARRGVGVLYRGGLLRGGLGASGCWKFFLMRSILSLDLGVFIGLEDKRAEKMTDQFRVDRAALHEQPEVAEETEILVDLEMAELAAVAFV